MHWTATERCNGGVALSSRELVRAAISAALRERRRGWAVRGMLWIAGHLTRLIRPKTPTGAA